MSVGWLPSVKLDIFGQILYQVFGDTPYHVGSSVRSKKWRDVDVVVMMAPEKFYHWAGPQGMYGMRWKALCAAFSALGEQITGLPIDFKIQEVKWANEKHAKGGRSAIGMRITDDYADKECPAHLKQPLPIAEDALCKNAK